MRLSGKKRKEVNFEHKIFPSCLESEPSLLLWHCKSLTAELHAVCSSLIAMCGQYWSFSALWWFLTSSFWTWLPPGSKAPDERKMSQKRPQSTVMTSLNFFFFSFLFLFYSFFDEFRDSTYLDVICYFSFKKIALFSSSFEWESSKNFRIFF